MTSEHICYDKSYLAEPVITSTNAEQQEDPFTSNVRQLFSDLQTNFPPWFAAFKETAAQGNKPLIKRYGPGFFFAKERILIRGNFLSLVASLESEVAVPALVSAITTVGSNRKVYTPEGIFHSLSYRFREYYSSADRWQIIRRPLKEQEREVLASVYYLLATELALKDERFMPFAQYHGGLKIKTPGGYIPIAEHYSSRYKRTSVPMLEVVDKPLPFSSLSQVIDPDGRLFQEFSSAATDAPEIPLKKRGSLKRLFVQQVVSLSGERDFFGKFISLVKAGKKPEEVVTIMEMFVDFLKGVNNNRAFSPTLHRFLGCLALYFYPDIPTAGALFKDTCYKMLADGWSIAEYIPTAYSKWADMEFAREVYNLALSQRASLTETQAETFWRRASFYTWTEIAQALGRDISNVRSYYFAALVNLLRQVDYQEVELILRQFTSVSPPSWWDSEYCGDFERFRPKELRWKIYKAKCKAARGRI